MNKKTYKGDDGGLHAFWLSSFISTNLSQENHQTNIHINVF